MSNTYNQNKFIFNKLIDKNYKLRKSKNDKNVLYAYTSDLQVKCEYIFFLIRYDDGVIQWTNTNPYIDNITRKQTEIIHSKISELYKNIKNDSSQKINNEDFENIIKDLIKNNVSFENKNTGDKWNCNWILTNKNKDKKYTEYYMITDIIYF